MATTIEQVRAEYGDTVEPYLVPDAQIQSAIDEAAADLSLRGVSVSTPLGARAQRFMAALDMVDVALTNVRSRPVCSISEGGDSVSYESLLTQAERIQQKLADLLDRLGGSPFEAVYDSY